MQKENALESVENNEPKGLGLRDALEIAVTAANDKPEPVESKKEEKPSEPEAPVVAPLEPPAEYTAEEKADFLQLSRKGQEAQLRLDKSRRSRLEEVRAAAKEYQEVKQLADTVNPYLKAMGLKEPSEVALKKAIKMWREFEEGDPKQMAAAYLKSRGVEVPEGFLVQERDSGLDDKIKPLQTELNQIKQELTQAKTAQAATVLQSAWADFESVKNAGGTAKYPDIGNTETGLKLAANIGSLVRGDTELSRQFIANVQSRVPNLTFSALLEEAYRYCGGRIDETSTAKTQNAKEQVQKSQMARASAPSRGSVNSGGTSQKKFKTYREAAQAALAQIKAD